ncbi:hypothetical protein Tco_1017373 [Tanacetum coccineum]|uniref:Uncharacterized protein n=1 Tax=Tanacetum coccineum TaxID=301880 RepID=A0ABQ5FRA2_9ASTR
MLTNLSRIRWSGLHFDYKLQFVEEPIKITDREVKRLKRSCIPLVKGKVKKKCMDKGSKERSPPHNLRQKPGQYICCQNHKLIADIENDIMDPVMQCTTLPSHSGFSQQKLVSFVTEIHTLSIDISFRDR